MAEQDRIETLLKQVAEGEVSPEKAALLLREAPFEDLGYAKLDHHRKLRTGTAEVVYGESKTGEQIAGIVCAFLKKGHQPVLITRMSAEKAEQLENALASLPEAERAALHYDPLSRVGVAGELPAPDGKGQILVITAGTSDIAVAEEAARTAEVLGNEVVRVYDAGVAGLHRLLAHLDEIMSARVIIAIAGMEGALASVVGGLASAPVIAVPTSVGYGANFGGLSALLSMLNSCAGGVSVVNIDNGFGAGFLASRINHM